MRATKILLVDDNEDLVDSLRSVLSAGSQRSLSIRTAASRATALEDAREHGFDVAIVDVKLPDGSGVELASELREIHPLGDTKPVAVDVRVIAATNQPLDQLLADGRFREDFYYRLNVMRFHLPPLRERREEILPFVDHFLTRECAELGKPVPALSDEAVEHLLLHRWPGNIRQLYNEMRRIAATIEPNE